MIDYLKKQPRKKKTDSHFFSRSIQGDIQSIERSKLFIHSYRRETFFRTTEICLDETQFVCVFCTMS
ncbi:unnamed protein product [Brassica rapa subsp. trilocularis]